MINVKFTKWVLLILISNSLSICSMVKDISLNIDDINQRKIDSDKFGYIELDNTTVTSNVNSNNLNNSKIVKLLLDHGAKKTKQNNNLQTDDLELQNVEHLEEDSNYKKRVSTCTKITGFFSALVHRCKKTGKSIEHGIYSLLRKRGVINIVSLAPLIVEAVGGYYGYKLGNDYDLKEFEKLILPVIGIVVPISLIDLCVNYKSIRFMPSGDFHDSHMPSISRGMIGITPTILLIICIAKAFQANNFRDYLFGATVSLMFGVITCIPAFWYNCNSGRPSSFSIKKLIKLPITVFIYIPYKQVSDYLHKKVSTYFNKFESTEQYKIDTNLSQQLKDLDFFPRDIDNIIDQYAQSDEKNIIIGFTNINSFHTKQDALKVLNNIYEYAQNGKGRIIDLTEII